MGVLPCAKLTRSLLPSVGYIWYITSLRFCEVIWRVRFWEAVEANPVKPSSRNLAHPAAAMQSTLTFVMMNEA